jgi:hypothetical protein
MRALVVSAVGTVALAFVALACTRGDGVDRAFLEAPCTNDATAEAFTPVSIADFSFDDIGSLEGPRFEPDDELYCRLRRALLTIEELPGWTRGDTGLREHLDERGLLACYLQLPGWHDGLQAKFIIPEDEDDRWGVVFIRQSVIHAPYGRAEPYMEAAEYQCQSRGSRDGEDHTSSFTELGIPAHGDEAIAWEETVRLINSDEPGKGFSISIRSGDVISTVLAAGEIERIDIEELARALATRLELVGPLPDLEPFAGQGCPPPTTPVPVDPPPAIAAALLQLSDFRGGWIRHLPAECMWIDMDWSECPGFGPDPFDESLPSGRTTFQHGGLGTVTHEVGVFPGGDGSGLFRSMRVTDESDCRVRYEGGAVTWRIAPWEFDAPGDDSFAYIVQMLGVSPADSTTLVVMWRDGDAVSLLAFTPGAIPSPLPVAVEDNELALDFLAEFVALADVKFAAAAEEINRLNR